MSLHSPLSPPVPVTPHMSIDRSGLLLRLQNQVKPSWPAPSESIGEDDEGIFINGKRFWAVQGPAAEAWRVIRHRIDTFLEERQGDIFEGQEESDIPNSIDCFMVGKRKRTACPFIVIASDNHDFSRHVMGLIQTSDWWARFTHDYPGFCRFALLRYLPRRLGNSGSEDQIWIYTSDRVKSLYGAPIFSAPERLVPGTKCSLRQATIGGVVYRDGHAFGLTVAHPFVSQNTHGSIIQETNNSDVVFEMDDVEGCSDCSSGSESGPSPVNTKVLEISYDERGSSGQPIEGTVILLGRLVKYSQGSSTDELDWALVDLEAGWYDYVEFLVESSTTTGTYTEEHGLQMKCPAPSTYGFPRKKATPIFVPGKGAALVRGVLSTTETLIWLPGAHRYMSLYKVHLAEDVLLGDCGKWIFDSSGKWYGHIIAGYTGSKIAFIGLSGQIIRDIFKDGQFSLRLVNPISLEMRLLAAVSQGKERMVSLLLDKGADANGTATTSTILQARSGLVRQSASWPMISADTDQNASTQYTYSLLYIAAEQGFDQVVKRLINNGAIVNSAGGRLGTALHAAVACYGNGEVVALLLNAGAEFNTQRLYQIADSSRSEEQRSIGPPLHTAAYYGNLDAVCVLLASGADVNLHGGMFETALQAAAANFGKAEIVQLLLEHGADVNARGGKYGTALQAAAKATAFYNERTVVEALLEAGADIFAGGGDFGNAFNAAAAAATGFGSDEIFRLLVNFGWEETLETYSDNFYPLTLKIIQGRGDACKMLEDSMLRTGTAAPFKIALYVASALGKADIVQQVLQVGGNVNAQDERRESALHVASEGGHEEVVRLLIDAGANVNAPHMRYLMETPLSRAVGRGHEKVVQLLIAARADVNPLDVPFGSILNEARYRGHCKIVRMLEDASTRADAAQEEFTDLDILTQELHITSPQATNTEIATPVEKALPGAYPAAVKIKAAQGENREDQHAPRSISNLRRAQDIT